MHAYLIIGKNPEAKKDKIEELLKKRKTTKIDFDIAKIEDVRQLNNFTKLSISTPTSLVVKDIDQATIPAANAFLKNLEEPQDNINYILTASSVHSVLPTIVSRCNVVITEGKLESINEKEIYKFLAMSTGNKFLHVDKIRKREDAIGFVEDIILTLHNTLHSNKPSKTPPDISFNIKETYLILENANKTLAALYANGNISLQLTNFIINISEQEQT